MSSGTSEIFLFEDYTLPMQDGTSLKPISSRLQDIRKRVRPLVESHAYLSKMNEHTIKEAIDMIAYGISLAQSTNSVVTVQVDNGNEITVSLSFSSFVLMEYPEILQFQIIAEKANSIAIFPTDKAIRNTMISFGFDLHEKAENDG